MNNNDLIFADRRDAGRRLAERLGYLRQENPIVVALPRGGVEVGFEIARAINAPLDIMVVRKIGAPGNPEFGIGAIAEDGTSFINKEVIEIIRIHQNDLDATMNNALTELRRQVQVFRAGKPPLDIKGRTVLLVDDGLATGGTAIAATRAIKKRGARKVILAIPVGARESVELLKKEADEVICLEIPFSLSSIGAWYEDFSQTSDLEVLTLLKLANTGSELKSTEVTVKSNGLKLVGNISVPSSPIGIVIFAHGSGSSRFSPRNMAVAKTLNEFNITTLLFDLLTEEEARNRVNVFDIPLLADRLQIVTKWVGSQSELQGLPLGYFGASTGAAAALWAAADLGSMVSALVSRGGRPDLADRKLPQVSCPTLLIVGGDDFVVIDLNREAQQKLRCKNDLQIIPGATHLFEEPGALEQVAELAAGWFRKYFLVSAAETRWKRKAA